MWSLSMKLMEVVARLNGGLGTPSSWRSSDTPDDLQSLRSLSPLTSCATPASSSDPGDLNLLDVATAYTIGVTENTPYACQFCDKAFPRLSYLKRHEQVHGDQMPFRCEFCNRLFKHKRSRDRHIKLHTGDRKYRCPHCESAFSRSDHLKIHLKTHDNAKPFQCTVCNRGYNTAAALTSHMQNHKKGDHLLGSTQVQLGMTANGMGPRESSPHGTQTPNVPDGPTFRCLECSSVFSAARDLQVHGEVHRDRSRVSPLLGHLQSSLCTSPYLLPCAFCPILCPGPDGLRNHVEHFHSNSCLLCREEFVSTDALEKHLKVHDPIVNGVRKDILAGGTSQLESRGGTSAKIACGFCNKTDFNSMDSLQHHVQNKHVPVLSRNGSPPSPHLARHKSGSSNLYHCESCALRFSSVHALQKHTLKHHDFGDQKMRDSLFCTHCTRVFPTPQGLSEHLHSVHDINDNSRSGRDSKSPDQPRSCSREPKSSFNGKESSASESDGKSNHKASMDGLSFNGHAPSSQFAHPGTLLCSQCNAAFQEFESFRAHLKTHLDAVVQKYTCPECEGEFPTEERLDSHMSTHFLSAGTEYGCQSCLKTFSKPDELQKHLMDLHAYHLYRCALCKESFDSKVAIQVHFAVKHSNESRLFRCTSCASAVFRSQVEFQVHVRLTHLLEAKNPQPFRCLFCDLSFPNEIQLQLHAGTHKKPFTCGHCDEGFHVEFLLDRHVQSKHTGEGTGKEPLPGSAVGANAVTADTAQNLSLKSRARNDVSSPIEGNRKEVKCDICDATFLSESSLTSHRKQAHNIRTTGSQRSGQATLSLYCAYCNESCKSRTELENHMKAHTVSPSKHKCNICDEMCPSATTLAEHKLTHCKLVSGNSCVVCRAALSNEEQFYSHVQQHNGKRGQNALCWPLPCVVCRQSLGSEVEVQMHAKFHLQNVYVGGAHSPVEHYFPCCVCCRHFESHHLIITGKQDSGHTYMCKDCFHSKSAVAGALAAMASAINIQPPPASSSPQTGLRCSECHVKFENSAELERHYSVQHKKTYQCIKCQMSFATEAEIQEHVATHVLHEGTEHDCRLCKQVFDSPAKLQCHLIEHTFEGCSNYTCYICSSVFTAPHLIQQHILEHGLNARPYDCGRCHQRFFFRAELDHHAILHEKLIAEEKSRKKDAPSEEIKCSSCPLTFRTSADMKDHLDSAHNEEMIDVTEDKDVHPCTDCNQVFLTAGSLQGHMESHSKGYRCSECEDSFSELRELNAHLQTHSASKPYECPICQKRFSRKENRKAHMKSHAKPFPCYHCGDTFSRRSLVKEHTKVHATPTTNPCNLCSGTFSTTRLLKLHLAEVHQKSFKETCPVCGDVFEKPRHLSGHLRKAHRARVGSVVDDEDPMEDPMEEDESEPSTRSSSSCDSKEMDSSDCSTLPDIDHDTANSPISVTNDVPVALAQTEVTA